MIGCYAHRWALWVKHAHEVYDELIQAINEVMKELRNLLGAAALEKIQQQNNRPQLVAKIRNQTRWSSVDEMVDRFNEIRHDISLIELPDVVKLMEILEDVEKRTISVSDLAAKIRPFASVTKALQDRKLTIFDAQTLFDCIVLLN